MDGFQNDNNTLQTEIVSTSVECVASQFETYDVEEIHPNEQKQEGEEMDNEKVLRLQLLECQRRLNEAIKQIQTLEETINAGDVH